METQDKTLTCSDCGNSFVFTAGEQRFYQEKGFAHEPRRCKDCRGKRKGDSGGGDRDGGYSGGGYGTGGYSSGGYGGGRGGGSRESFTATCSQCGGPAKLSFQPNPDRPVYCRTCFQAKQTERGYR